MQQEYVKYIEGKRTHMSPGELKIDVESEEMSLALIRIMKEPSRRDDYLKIKTLLEQAVMELDCRELV